MFCGVVSEEERLLFLCTQIVLSAFVYSKQSAGHIIASVMERAVNRIIDANFNRAREAIRVMEEFCRFSLDSIPLFERTKQLRHELSSIISQLGAKQLIASRDTLGDVGVGKRVDKQLFR